MKQSRIYKEERFRTPLARERALGVWVDRIGWSQSAARSSPRYRVLGQYAAVAVEAGEGVLETVAHGTHALGAGDVIMLSPGMATRYYPDEKWDSRWVVWNGPEAAVLEQLSGLGLDELVIRGGAMAVLTAWQRLNPLMERQDFESLLGRKLALLDLIRELSVLRRVKAGGGDPRFLAAALRELARSEGAPDSVAAMARRLHVSPAHFRRLFKAHTGTSPKAFQMAQRVTRAKEMFFEGRSIKETAAQLGFADVFHFMRLFKRVTGQTAGQYAAVFAKGRTAEPLPGELAGH